MQQDLNCFSPMISPVRQNPEESNFFATPMASPMRSQEDDYEHCPNCARKFFIGRLKLHLKSCKEGKAHKPVKVKAIPERQTEESVVADASKRLISHGNEIHEDNRRYANIELSPVKAVPKEQNESECEEEENDDVVEREKADDGRVGCSVCERFFHMNRIHKHEKACKKSNKKRPIFDTSKQRAIPEQGEVVVVKKAAPETIKVKKIVQKEKPSIEVVTEKVQNIQNKEEDNKKKANWKKQHENFIENLRFNRKLKQMEANGEDTTNLVAPTIVNDTYVSCTYCFRKFAPHTAERHIPKCKDIFNRPKPPKNIRLEKLEESKAKLNIKKLIQHTEGDNTSPKEETPQAVSLKTQQGKFIIKKTPSSESKRKAILPSIKNPENVDNSIHAYEINLTPQKLRSYRSQSPNSMKKVFTEPMPKKEDLLQNYQSLLARAGTYATEPCPYCQRKFGSHAAERHVPVCKELHGRLRGKKSEGQALFEEKKRPQMYLTSFATKIGFANKLLENDMIPRSTHNASTTTNYKPFFGGKRAHNSERHLVPIKKSSQSEPKELIVAPKPNLLQKSKFTAGLSHFCTSCGTKFAKVHNFCGQCGHKKDAIYIA